jgi:hypothetical protein
MDGDNAIQALAEKIESVLPRGVMGEWTALPAAFVATQSAIDCFGSHVRTLANGRTYKVTVSVAVVRAVAGDVSAVVLNVDGAVWHQGYAWHGAGNTGQTVTFVSFVNGAGTARTLSVNALRASGTGNINLANVGTLGSNTLMIEDIGLVPPASLDVETQPAPSEPEGQPK